MYYQISFQSQLWIHSRIIFYANHSSDKLLWSLVTLFPSTEIFLTIKYLGEIHVYYYHRVVNVTQGLHGWMGTKCIYPFPKISRHGALFDETFLHCITSDKIFSRCSVGHLPPNCNRVVFFWTFTTSPQFLHFEAFGGSWRFIECFGTVWVASCTTWDKLEIFESHCLWNISIFTLQSFFGMFWHHPHQDLMKPKLFPYNFFQSALLLRTVGEGLPQTVLPADNLIIWNSSAVCWLLENL